MIGKCLAISFSKQMHPSVGFMNIFDLFMSFKYINITTQRIPQLAQAVQNCYLIGHFEPFVLLVGANEQQLETIKSSWIRSHLKSPFGFRIDSVSVLADAGGLLMQCAPPYVTMSLDDVICQLIWQNTQFEPSCSPEKLYSCLQTVHQDLRMAPPSFQTVKSSLSTLVRSGAVYFSGHGYSLLTADKLAVVKWLENVPEVTGLEECGAELIDHSSAPLAQTELPSISPTDEIFDDSEQLELLDTVTNTHSISDSEMLSPVATETVQQPRRNYSINQYSPTIPKSGFQNAGIDFISPVTTNLTHIIGPTFYSSHPLINRDPSGNSRSSLRYPTVSDLDRCSIHNHLNSTQRVQTIKASGNVMLDPYWTQTIHRSIPHKKADLTRKHQSSIALPLVRWISNQFSRFRTIWNRRASPSRKVSTANSFFGVRNASNNLKGMHERNASSSLQRDDCRPGTANLNNLRRCFSVTDDAPECSMLKRSQLLYSESNANPNVFPQQPVWPYLRGQANSVLEKGSNCISHQDLPTNNSSRTSLPTYPSLEQYVSTDCQSIIRPNHITHLVIPELDRLTHCPSSIQPVNHRPRTRDSGFADSDSIHTYVKVTHSRPIIINSDCNSWIHDNTLLNPFYRATNDRPSRDAVHTWWATGVNESTSPQQACIQVNVGPSHRILPSVPVNLPSSEPKRLA